MKKKSLIVFYLIKIILLSLIFSGAVIFENAQGKRFHIILTVFAVYLLIGIIRNSLFKDKKLYKYTFLIDIVLIYFLEHQSRYLISYFYHSFYIAIIIEAAFMLKRKESLSVGILTVIVSLVKYFMLLYYKYSIGNLSQIVFFIIMNVLILGVISFAKYYKEEKEKKDELYTELLKTHTKLKEYSNRVKELVAIEERNKIARDIHDTLGHSMTGVIMQIEMADHMIGKDDDSVSKLLSNAKCSAREGLQKIREIVETLEPNKNISKGIESIKVLINRFKEITRVDISLKIKGRVVRTSETVNTVLYRVIQESLTNSIRHGHANRININIKYLEHNINFIIQDNGNGADKIHKGFGLKGIINRIESIGGKVCFKSEDGFVVEGKLPLEVQK